MGGTRSGRSGPMRREGGMAYRARDDDDGGGWPILPSLSEATSDALVLVINGGSWRSGNSFEVYGCFGGGSGGDFEGGSIGWAATCCCCCAWTANLRHVVVDVIGWSR